MSIVDLMTYLEQTTRKHPIPSLIYLERCFDKAKDYGLSRSCREEAEKILNEMRAKVSQGHKDASVLTEVVERVSPVLIKN